MGSALFNVLFKVMGTIVGILTAPLSLVITTLFPNFATLITNFNSGVTTLIGGGIAYFSYYIPPITKVTILLWLGVVIAYYVAAINVHLILKIIQILKNIKFW